MIILEFVQTFFAIVLMGYLTLANGAAGGIETLTTPTTPQQTIAQTERSSEKSRTHLTRLSSERSAHDPIPRVLLENAAYQQAAAGANLNTEPTELFETPKSVEERVAASLVNVFCQYKTGEYQRTTTGTGFFIHQNGVVLTNAHVAQFLLFEEIDKVHDAHCTLRSGDPATAHYGVELLYISPVWISENASLVEAENPSGTGERDFALLYVSEALGDTELPAEFPALSFDTSLLSQDAAQTSVLAGGYPAMQLHREGNDTELSPVVSSTTIERIYTFGSNYADVLAIGESPVGEQGSSGGPVVRPDGGAIGLIVTKGDEQYEGKTSLRALTLSYIDRAIKEETGFPLSENMHGDLAKRGAVFKDALVPFLSTLLTKNLK